jgi:hypothetical protein
MSIALARTGVGKCTSRVEVRRVSRCWNPSFCSTVASGSHLTLRGSVHAIIVGQQQTPGPIMNLRIADASRRKAASALGTIAWGCIAALAAPVAIASAASPGFAEPPVPAIGTKTVADAELLVRRPRTTPCTVSLFANQEFAGFTPVALSYAPPHGCPGPWAKIVL